LQHKVGWFTIKRGVIHANPSVLDNPPDYIWASIEGAPAPVYVRRDAVRAVETVAEEVTIYKRVSDRRDVGAGIDAADRRIQHEAAFENYTLDWRALLADVRALIQARPGMSRATLLNTARKSVKLIAYAAMTVAGGGII